MRFILNDTSGLTLACWAAVFLIKSAGACPGSKYQRTKSPVARTGTRQQEHKNFRLPQGGYAALQR